MARELGAALEPEWERGGVGVPAPLPGWAEDARAEAVRAEDAQAGPGRVADAQVLPRHPD